MNASVKAGHAGLVGGLVMVGPGKGDGLAVWAVVDAVESVGIEAGIEVGEGDGEAEDVGSEECSKDARRGRAL